MDLAEDILSLGRLGNIQRAGHKNTAEHSRKENPEETEKRGCSETEAGSCPEEKRWHVVLPLMRGGMYVRADSHNPQGFLAPFSLVKAMLARERC